MTSGKNVAVLQESKFERHLRWWGGGATWGGAELQEGAGSQQFPVLITGREKRKRDRNRRRRKSRSGSIIAVTSSLWHHRCDIIVVTYLRRENEARLEVEEVMKSPAADVLIWSHDTFPAAGPPYDFRRALIRSETVNKHEKKQRNGPAASLCCPLEADCCSDSWILCTEAQMCQN